MKHYLKIIWKISMEWSLGIEIEPAQSKIILTVFLVNLCNHVRVHCTVDLRRIPFSLCTVLVRVGQVLGIYHGIYWTICTLYSTVHSIYISWSIFTWARTFNRWSGIPNNSFNHWSIFTKVPTAIGLLSGWGPLTNCSPRGLEETNPDPLCVCVAG